MDKITKRLTIKVSPEKAYQNFLSDLKSWWPREYTWSQDKLADIKIEEKQDGLCTEVGPYGFRCDWGRVTELIEGQRIGLKWQIGFSREPIPDPEKASDILLVFKPTNKTSTIIEFEHRNFENHGKQAVDYRKMMNGPQGWNYILNRFKEYCEK